MVGTTKNRFALNDHPSWTWSNYVRAWLLRSSHLLRSKLDELERTVIALVGNNHEMAHRSEPPKSPNLTLQLGPGAPGDSHLDVRISPNHSEELKEFFEAEGLHVSGVLEHSVGGWLEVLAVALRSDGVVAVAITKFHERNKDKEFDLVFGDQHVKMKGYGGKEAGQLIGTVIEAIAEQQRQLHPSRADILKVALPSTPGEDVSSA